MYHYIFLHHYHPWYGPMAFPFIPPPPIPPPAVSYRNWLEGLWFTPTRAE